VIRAVWSFWSKPYTAFHHKAWISDRHHLLSWILSVRTAQRHYPDTLLVTDDAGANLLVNRLGLRFGNVSTDLNDLRKEDPHWWTLGKLYAYRSQRQPFIHLDNDVFLWRGLPDHVTKSVVFAQNPERFIFGEGAYRPDRFENAMRVANGRLPPEWRWYTHRRGNVAICCGIVGGSNNDFLAHYAEQAIQMIQHLRDRPEQLEATERLGCNIVVEQYFLAACVYYHQLTPKSRFHGVNIDYLFESEADSFMNAEKLGYTHLIAGAKKNLEITERLERRVRQEYPEDYSRLASCLEAA
jgi:hypothetical protein